MSELVSYSHCSVLLLVDCHTLLMAQREKFRLIVVRLICFSSAGVSDRKINVRGCAKDGCCETGEPTTMLPLDVLAIVCDVVDVVDDDATDLRYFNESQWDLYSIGVFGGRFSTRRSVSRIRTVQF